MSSEQHLRLVSESDSEIGSESDSGVASNERTNERTNGSDPYGCRSGNSSRRTGVYEELDGGGVMTSEYAQSRIAKARELIAETRAVCCRHGVLRSKCSACLPGELRDIKANATAAATENEEREAS